MNRNKLLILGIIAVAIGFIMAYSFGGSDETYIKLINNARDRYFQQLKFGKDSPIKDQKAFESLTYYDAKSSYRINSSVNLINSKDVVLLQTSVNDSISYRKFAFLNFDLNGHQCTLLLFQNTTDETDFFLPFTDETNGLETYGAGRYLPINYRGGDHIELDFNRAFNPYCAYNAAYSCPIPPRENHLTLRVEAGEKANQKY